MKRAWCVKETTVFILSLLMVWGILSGVSRAEEFSIPGLLEAWDQVMMKAKVSGTLGPISIEEGGRVKKGSILLELENEREKAMIKLAEARLEKAKASLLEAKVALERSKKDLDRKEMMREVIPQKDYENAQDLVLQHDAAVLTRETEIRESEAELHLRQAELKNTQIIAPFDGMITQIPVRAGETVAALTTPICEVVNLNKLCVQVAVPIQYLPILDKGMRVSIQVEKDALPLDKRFEGEIWYINPIVDPTSRRFKVKILLGNPHPMVRPGMIAEVFFKISSKKTGEKR
jgi:membrane fusion protein (multidrug efflux system)